LPIWVIAVCGQQWQSGAENSRLRSCYPADRDAYKHRQWRLFYDSTTKPHGHFYNLDSGELTDIPAGGIRVTDLPELPDGGYLESVEVVIKVRSKPPEYLT